MSVASIKEACAEQISVFEREFPKLSGYEARDRLLSMAREAGASDTEAEEFAVEVGGKISRNYFSSYKKIF